MIIKITANNVPRRGQKMMSIMYAKHFKLNYWIVEIGQRITRGENSKMKEVRMMTVRKSGMQQQSAVKGTMIMRSKNSLRAMQEISESNRSYLPTQRVQLSEVHSLICEFLINFPIIFAFCKDPLKINGHICSKIKYHTCNQYTNIHLSSPPKSNILDISDNLTSSFTTITVYCFQYIFLSVFLDNIQCNARIGKLCTDPLRQ